MRKYIAWFVIVGFVLSGLLLTAQQAKKEEKKAAPEDVKVPLKKCQSMQKNNDATDALIKSVAKQIAALEKELGTWPPQAARDLKDFNEWYTKANKLAEETRKKVDAGECNKQIIKDLGWVWQYYVKAATMAVNAKSRGELELKNRKRKKKK